MTFWVSMTRTIYAGIKWWHRWRLARRISKARRTPAVETVAPLSIRLIALRRYDEAEDLLRRGLASAPDDPALLEQLALCAHNTGRYGVALDRWRHLCAVKPDLPMAWCGISSNARELRRYDEAGAAAAEALSRFPDELIVISEAAFVNECRGAFVEAAHLFGRVIERLPAEALWHLSRARNLLQARRYDDVEAVLAALPSASEDLIGAGRRAALAWGEIAEAAAELNREKLALFMKEAERRFGDEAFVVRQVAETTSNLAGARDSLRRRLESSPADMAARECYVRILARSDLIEDAEREIETSLRLAPGDPTLRALRGLIAMRRQDWDAANAEWSAYLKTHPHDLTAAYLIDRVERVRQLERAEQTRGAGRPTPIAPEVCDDPTTRHLLLQFESIGVDCEFGAVQRRYGAEPLSLLRWTDTDVPTLMAALEARFEGMGDPENTELTVGSLGEIQIRDTRWHLAMHTFLFESEVSLSALLPKMCRRTAYLRDKLLDELRAGQKTLVFKSNRIDRDELLALHDALLAFGPNRLVNVRLAAASPGFEADEPGSLRELRPGLLVGRLSRMSILADLAYDEWVKICEAAAELSPAVASTADVRETVSSAA